MSEFFDGSIQAQWPEACMKIEQHMICAMSIICVDQGNYIIAYTRPPKLWLARIEIERKKKFEKIIEGQGATLDEALSDAEKDAQKFLLENRIE